MNFDSELSIRVSEIENMMKDYLPGEAGFQKTVMEAMNYSILAGGKRLRPMLMQETFRLFDGKDLAILEPFMAAIEMIHTYSLVHDDLPAMDNDEYRRGRKTTHVVYGEAMAILAGDGLLNYAFETAAGAYHKISGCDNTNELILYRRIMRALEILAAKAGIYGMIGGQVIDIEPYDGTVDRERLDHMYQMKTSALIEASMMIGAVLAGATEEETEKIEQIARDIGLAFQIKDDILDVSSSSEVLGKPVHSDERNQKATYVTIMELEGADWEVQRITDRAIRIYEELPYRNDYLKELIMWLISRNK